MFKIVTKISELPDFEGPVFCDIETDGLYTNIRMIQFFTPQVNQVYILDLAPVGYNKIEYVGAIAALRNYLKTIHSVWYNASYDLGTLNVSPDKIDDLYYAMKMAYPQFGLEGFGLKKIVKKLRYTEGLYDSTQEDHGKKGYPRGSYVSQSQLRYASIDVIALEKIWNDPKIRNVIQNNKAYALDIQSLKYSVVYQQNGLLLDHNMWAKALESSKEDVITYSALLPATLNPNSYIQVRRHLSIEESDREALVKHSLSSSDTAKDADNIIRLKRALKEVKYLQSINFDRMYTKFNPGGAISGRFTSAGGDIEQAFNSQQIPRQFQHLFNQPTEDTVVIDADYSTLELRLAATIFGVKTMYKQLLDGRDLHTEMAIHTTGKALHPDGIIQMGGSHRDTTVVSREFITDNDRTNAKSVGFGFVFGMSAESFIAYARTSFGLTVSKANAQTFRDKYFQLYPEIKRRHNFIWNNYKKPNFFVYTALGRPIKPKMGTDGINTPIQGSGAEVVKLAIKYLVEDNKDKPMLSWIYNVVHDAIYLRVPRTEDSKDISKRLNVAMLKGWTELSKTELFLYKDVPMIAECEIND